MKDPVDRLPSYVSDLLAVERAAPPPPRQARARVWARVAGTLAAATTAGPATAAAAAKGASGGLLASVVTAKTALVVAAVAAAGVTGGLASHRRHARVVAAQAAQPEGIPRASTPPPAPAIGASPTPPPPLVPLPEPAVVPPSRSAAPRSVARRPKPATPRATEALADESALIEAARAGLAAQDTARAATLLERHARAHPAGQMEEEREALWVLVLAAQGDGVAARARAADFRRRFPRSIQLEVVAAALEAIP
jgi:hypothetical protein